MVRGRAGESGPDRRITAESADGNILRMERPIGPLTLSEDDRRALAVWAADCAERTLSLFEVRAPNDLRPRDALDGVRAFAAATDEIHWAVSHASPAVRAVLSKLPPPPRDGPLGALINDLHKGIARSG